jgi:hypothetical protein
LPAISAGSRPFYLVVAAGMEPAADVQLRSTRGIESTRGVIAADRIGARVRLNASQIAAQ